MNTLGHYHFTDFAYADDVTILFLISSKQTLDPPSNVNFFFHSKLLLYNCKFRRIKDEQSDTITSPSLILLMLTMLPSLYLISSNQTVLQSMPLLLYWIPIVAKDKTPKRGCR